MPIPICVVNYCNFWIADEITNCKDTRVTTQPSYFLEILISCYILLSQLRSYTFWKSLALLIYFRNLYTYRWSTCSRYITYGLESTFSFPERTSWIIQRTRHCWRHICIEIIFARDNNGYSKYNFHNVEEKTSNFRQNGNCKGITFARKTNHVLTIILRIIERIYERRAKWSTSSTKS